MFHPIRRPRFALWIVSYAILACAVHARADDPLYDQRPYDQIVLNAANDSEVLRVIPLDFPNRRVPEPFPSGLLEVRLVDQPSQPYEVSWGSISRVELFEQLLLKEATRLVQAGKFDEAFDYFSNLTRDYPDLPGLNAAIATYLRADAMRAFKNGDYDRSLAILTSLYARDPRVQGLSAAVDAVVTKVVEQRLAQREWSLARQALDVVEGQFSGLELQSPGQWRLRFEQAAKRQIERGEQLLAQGKFTEARQAARQAAAIFPEVPSVETLLARVQESHPSLTVGVFERAPMNSPQRIDNWASTRAGYLLHRTLSELRDYTSENGVYSSPLGPIALDATGRRVTFDFTAGDPLIAFAVSRWIIQMGQVASGAIFDSRLGALLSSVDAQYPGTIDVDFTQSLVKPEAFFRFSPLSDGIDAGGIDAELNAADDRRMELELPAGASIATIEEVLFDDDNQAAAALIRGDVDLLDRVPPWLLSRLRSVPDVSIGSYRLPTIHVLLPSGDQPLLEQREFRRALCYGIDRERIVREVLTGGEPVEGYVVLSGPFPWGKDLSDPVRYGYDDQIKPRPYEPRLAAILAAVAWSNVQKRQREQAAVDSPSEGEESSDKATDEAPVEEAPFPTLRLAHATDPVARAACESIQNQLRLVGIPIKLEELGTEELMSEGSKYDLRYAELSVWEPLSDARILLGPQGVAAQCSDAMQLELLRLDRAANMNQVGESLRRIHGIAHGDLPVVPLWQTANYFAYRNELQGVPQSTVHLYQTISSWTKRFGGVDR